MAFGQLILTNAANSFTAQAWASSGVITITRVGFGSGFPGVTDFVPGYTGLKVPVMNGTITGINNLVAGQLTVRSNISSANAPFTFNVNEIGIFGKYAGGAETLLAYCTTGSNTGDTVVPTGGGTPVVKDYALLMIWQQAISSSGVIQLIQQVGLHAGSHLNTGVDPISVASSSHTGFVPVSPGDGLQSPISTSPVTWSPVMLAITSSTTLYVSTSGNDSTAKPNDISHPWLTTQGALNWLNPYIIVPGVTVTVSHLAGTWNLSSSINVMHPQSGQITITGPVISLTTLSSLSTSGTSAFLTVSSITNISVGDWIFIEGLNAVAFNLQTYMEGAFKVTGISGSVVTVNNPASLSVSGITSGTVTPIKVIINAPSGDSAIKVPKGCGAINNISFVGVGTSSGNGLWCNGPGQVVATYCSFTGFQGGVYSVFNDGRVGGVACENGGTAQLNNCSLSVCYFGVRCVQGGSAIARLCYANSNTYGFDADAGALTLFTCCAGANSISGISSARGGSIYISGTITTGNGQAGLQANTKGVIIAINSPYSYGNGIADLQAFWGGLIQSNAGYSGYTSISPALNTIDSTGAIIIH